MAGWGYGVDWEERGRRDLPVVAAEGRDCWCGKGGNYSDMPGPAVS